MNMINDNIDTGRAIPRLTPQHRAAVRDRVKKTMGEVSDWLQDYVEAANQEHTAKRNFRRVTGVALEDAGHYAPCEFPYAPKRPSVFTPSGLVAYSVQQEAFAVYVAELRKDVSDQQREQRVIARNINTALECVGMRNGDTLQIDGHEIDVNAPGMQATISNITGNNSIAF